MFHTLDQAAKRIARQTINPEFTADSLKQLAEAGTLKICFPYRGTLGVFKFPAATLPPVPEKTIYFDGYLRSVARPRLRSDAVTLGTCQVIDQLTPTAVEIASTNFADPKIDIQPPNYWGRVRDEIKHGGGIQSAMMERNSIPESEWLINEAELDNYLQLTRVSADGGSAQPGKVSSNQAPPQNTDAPVIKETPQQRGERFLNLLEAEEKHGKRGALARVAAHECFDSSNMRKDIQKAKAARASKVREGSGWIPQTVIGGKRKT